MCGIHTDKWIYVTREIEQNLIILKKIVQEPNDIPFDSTSKQMNN